MRPQARTLTVAAAIFSASCGEPLPAQRSTPAVDALRQNSLDASVATPVAFTNATVINPGAAEPEPNMTVIVRDGRIAAMGRTGRVAIAEGTLQIDATGRFLIPGLWDAHAHVSYPGECSLPIMIAHGVTAVRDLGGPPAEGIAWRREINEGKRIGPHLFLAGLNIESAQWMDDVERMIARSDSNPRERIRRLWESSPRFRVGDEGDARAAVDTAVKLGMDVVKFRNLRSNGFRAVAAAARRVGIPVAGHAARDISLAEAAEAGQRSLEHGANLHSLAQLPAAERRAQYERMVRAGMFVTPTLVSDGMWAPDSLVLAVLADTAGADDSRRRTLSRAQRGMWREAIVDRRQWSTPMPRPAHDSIFAIEIGWVREAHQAGVSLLAGTDLGTLLTFPGSSVHEELAVFVERVGLTPMEALGTATVLPARFFGVEKEMGTIAVGKRADLVLLGADPLRDIRNTTQIDGVVAAGRYFGPADIAALKQCKSPPAQR